MTGFLDDAITAADGSAASAVAWSHRGQLHATVIAKATFGFASDTDMVRVAPEPILQADVHYQKNPARSVRFASDLAPYLRLVDAVLTGQATPPTPGPVRSLLVRFTVIDEGQTALDRSIVAHDPAGFERMPLVYERAYGGLGVLDNPMGAGATADSTAPNLVDPSAPTRPACFAPLGRSWPSRKRLLGKTPRKLLDAEIAQIPDDFAWGYYQTAPADQQLARLGGGAWIMLEGICAGHPLLRMRLPDVRGLAYVYGLGAEALPLDLTIDTLRVDADEERCQVVLRGSLPVPSEAALGALRIMAGVASAGAPVTWPALRPMAARASVSSGGPRAASAGQIPTLALDGELAPQAALPFSAGPNAASPMAAAPKAAGTIALAPDDQAELAVRPAVPFVSAPAGGIHMEPPQRPKPRVATGTLAVEPEEEPVRARPAATPLAAAPPPIAPAVPVAPVAAAPATAAPPPAPPPPAPAASPAPAPAREKKAAEPWAPPPPAAAPAPPPPPPVAGPVAGSKELKKGLYGRFGKP